MSLSSSAMSLEKSLPSAAVKAILDRLETLPEDGQTFDFRLRASDRDRHVVLALIHCGARARHEVGAVLAELDAEKARADAAEVRCLRAEERIASLVTQVEAAEARERRGARSALTGLPAGEARPGLRGSPSPSLPQYTGNPAGGGAPSACPGYGCVHPRACRLYTRPLGVPATLDVDSFPFCTAPPPNRLSGSVAPTGGAWPPMTVPQIPVLGVSMTWHWLPMGFPVLSPYVPAGVLQA